MARHILILVFCLGVFKVATAEPAAAPERFLAYKVERIDPRDAPVIDGKLDDSVWKDKAAITTLRNFLGPLAGEFASQKSEFTLLCDGARLYLAATFFDDDMASVRHNPTQEPFWNDCAEIYFDPLHNGMRRIQLVIDCGGQKYWHKNFDDGYGWWDDNSWHMLAKWDAAAARGTDRWTAEIAIDCVSFGIDPASGKICGFNPCRFRLGSKRQEFSAWGFGGGERQKSMKDWGHLIFCPAGGKALGVGVTREDVALVYPDLGERVLEVPVTEGFTLFSKDGEATRKFADLLAPMIEKLEARTSATKEAMGGLDGKNQNRAALQKRLDELAAESVKLKSAMASQPLTLGVYDKTADGLGKALTAMDELYWKIRLAALAAAGNNAQEGKKQ